MRVLPKVLKSYKKFIKYKNFVFDHGFLFLIIEIIEITINNPNHTDVLVPDKISEIIELTTISASSNLWRDFLKNKTSPIVNVMVTA